MQTTKNKEKAFITLLEQHKRLIVKIASSYFNNATDRNDLVQEIILQLWKAFPKFKEEKKASTWIYRIALNVAITNFRKEKNRQKKLFNYRQTVKVLEWQEPKLEEKLKLLYSLISELNPIERAIILLHAN